MTTQAPTPASMIPTIKNGLRTASAVAARATGRGRRRARRTQASPLTPGGPLALVMSWSPLITRCRPRWRA
jgi:hypothetical protein